MDISFVKTGICNAKVLVLGVTDEGLPDSTAALLPAETRSVVLRAGAAQCNCGSFDGRIGDSIEIIAPYGMEARRILLVGIGDPGKIAARDLQIIGGNIVAAVMATREAEIDVLVERPQGVRIAELDWVAHIAFGAKLRNYKYMRCRSGLRRREPAPVARIRIHSDVDGENSAFLRLADKADGVHLARDLVNDPPNLLTPAAFVERARELAPYGLKVDALDRPRLAELGMNGILAVGRASVHEPRLLVVEWRGATDRTSTDLALVGKGVTFDCGGINLKPGRFLHGMKGDMAAGAAVLGTLYGAARSRLPLNIAGIIPVVENAISGDSYRPSDIIRTARGDTIEVKDTDAEGRLILIDAMWYASEFIKPGKMISAGTLGGSGFFGLGLKYGGLYTEHETLASELLQAGHSSGEPLWRMPFDDEMDEELEKSDVADMLQQVDMWVHGADSGYIARLLRRSAAGTPWSHLEMCRLEWAIEDRPDCPRGATGYGVRLLSQLLDDMSADGYA